jgi:inosose dehydratase
LDTELPDLGTMLSRPRREMDDVAVTSAGATSCAGAWRTTASRSSAASCRSASPSPPRGTRAERAAEIARERGYEPVFHHHTATYVEELPEIERFLADTDVALLLDSGHLTPAGGDPIAVLRDWREWIRSHAGW